MTASHLHPLFNLDTLLDTSFPANAQLSPDGRWVAFEYGPSNKPKDAPQQKAIHIANVETGAVTVLAGTEAQTNDSPCWSPDGLSLAYLSNQASAADKQLMLADVTRGQTHALTDLRGEVDDPSWSPDGRSIAFLFDGTPGVEEVVPPDPLVVDESPRFKRIWIHDFEASDLRVVTPPDVNVHEYAWSSESTRIAVVASTHPNPWQGWYSAQLYVVDLATGVMSQVCALSQQIGRLTWSPDGRFIAFVMGVMSDEGNVAGEVYAVPATGGEIQCLTPALDHSITWIAWRDEGIVYGGVGIDSTLHGVIDPATCEIRRFAEGVYGVNGWGPKRLSLARDGAFATVRESFVEPPNVYIGSLGGGEWRRLTTLPIDHEALPPLRVENRFWSHADGTPVHGFLIYPPDYQPGKRYPLFLHVHGGPSLAFTPRFSSHWERLMTSLGCLVLMPNPRGSWGRGHSYQAANVGDLGGGDWQDIDAGVDALIAEGIVDPDRMAVGGWSYGGYLVTWGVTQTNRFRCAVAGASITNYESNYGVVLNREWQTTMFGSNVYDDVERHRARSPIVHVRKVKTPTLLVHGQCDVVAPPQQSEEFYTALRYFDVPAQLALYPREPHGFRERAHQHDLYSRIRTWIERFLFDEGE